MCVFSQNDMTSMLSQRHVLAAHQVQNVLEQHFPKQKYNQLKEHERAHDQLEAFERIKLHLALDESREVAQNVEALIEHVGALAQLEQIGVLPIQLLERRRLEKDEIWIAAPA